MKLKIVSDGTSFGSKLIDEESGKMIKSCSEDYLESNRR